MELVKGDTIVVHPTTEANGEWIVERPAVVRAKVAEIAVSTPEKLTGKIATTTDTLLTVKRDDRQAVIEGLRELADFLEANPDLAIGSSESIHYFPENKSGVDDAFAEVDRVAEILGVTPVNGAHYKAKRKFGAIEYEALVCKSKPKPGDEQAAPAESAVQA